MVDLHGAQEGLDVQVVTVGGDVVASLHVGSDWHVAAVKRAIEEQAHDHPPAPSQRLLYDQKELKDAELLSACVSRKSGRAVLQLVRVLSDFEIALQDLEDEDAGPVARQKAVETIGRYGESGSLYAPLLIGILNEPDESLRVRRAASDALAQMGASVVPHLLPCIDDLDEHTSKAAAGILVRIGSPRTRVGALQAFARLESIASADQKSIAQCLEDSDVNVRNAAVEVLVKIGEPAMPNVVQRLGSNNLPVRRAAVQVFSASAKLAEPYARALVSCFADDSTDMQLKGELCQIFMALGQPIVPHILRYLDSDSGFIRYCVCSVLSEIHDLHLSLQHVDKIKICAHDPNEIVAASACNCLMRLRGTSELYLICDD